MGVLARETFYDGQITVIHGDCLDVLPTLEAQSIDAVITDVPSGRTACAWDVVIPFEAMWKALKHVAKPRAAIVLLGCTQPFTSMVVMSNPKQFRYDWVWYKNTQTGMSFADTQPMRAYESILVFGGSGGIYNKQQTRSRMVGRRFGVKGGRGGRKGRSTQHLPNIELIKSDVLEEFINPRNVLEFDVVPNGRKGHSTQKPLALMEYLIRTYTQPGDVVLDFCAGSGTTAVAALATERRCIAIEKDATYYRVACERIASAPVPLPLEVAV